MEFIIRSRILHLFVGIVLLLTSLTSQAATSEKKTLLVYGDSISAAYGLEIDQGWVSLLQKKLNDGLPQWQVTNLSISGETSAGGLSRLPAALDRYNPDLVLLELGANDGLQGVPLDAMHRNFQQMLALLKKRNIPVLLFEMHIPPNYGPVYTKGFNAIYQQLSEEFSVPIMPFFMEGIAGVPELNQPDGIHPVAGAQQKLLDNVWPVLEPYLIGETKAEEKTELKK